VRIFLLNPGNLGSLRAAMVDRERHGGGSSRNAWFPFEPFAVEALPVAPHIWFGFPVWFLHEPKTTLPPLRRQRCSVPAADPIALPTAPCFEAQQILQNRASQEPFSLRAAFLERNFNRPPYRQCTALNGDG